MAEGGRDNESRREEARRQARKIIKKVLGVDDSLIRARGLGPLLAEVAEKRGLENVTRCDADSGHTGQYFGDLLKDLKSRK